MDELEFLKQSWKSQESKLPKVKAKEIYGLLHKKSSSSVKWIFIISLIELGLGISLNIVFYDDAFWKIAEELNLKTAAILYNLISYAVTAVFIYFFYRNYKTISSTQSVSGLMKKIIKTRKVVHYYIMYIILSSGISGFITYLYMNFYYLPEKYQQFIVENKWLVIAKGILVFTILAFLIWGIYALIYGLILKRLLRNYKELQKIE